MKSNFFLTIIALLACISANADGTITYEEALKSENFSKANEARKNGNADEAIMYCKLELKDNPNNGYAWFYLGWNLGQKRQYSESLDAFNQALRFLPKNDSLWTGFAHLNIAMTYEDEDKALQEYCLAIEAAPSKIDLWKERARFYETHHQYDKAYADYEKVISLKDTVAPHYKKAGPELYHRQLPNFDTLALHYGPNDTLAVYLAPNFDTLAAYYGRAGHCLREQGLYEAAIEKFDYAIKRDAQPWHYMERAICYDSKGEYRSLARDIIKAFELDIALNDHSAMCEVEDIIDRISANPEAKKCVSDTLNAKAKNDPVGTALLYSYFGDAYSGRLVSDEQSYEQARLDGIVAYIKALDLVGKELEHTSSYHFNISLVYSSIARLYDELGDQEMAAIYAEKATTITDFMADYCYYAGKYSEASKALEKAIKVAPDYYSLYYKRALMKSNAKDIDGAIEDCTRLITLSYMSTSVYLLRGDMYMAKGDTEAAIKDYQTVLEIDKRDKKFRMDKNNNNEDIPFAFLMLGQKDSAEIAMQQLLDYSLANRNLYSYSTYYYSADCYSAACLMSRMGDKNRAIEYLKVSFEKGYSRFGLLDVDYRLDAIRDMPEFKALVKEYKQKQIEKNVKFAEYIGGETRMVRQKSVTDCPGL